MLYLQKLPDSFKLNDLKLLSLFLLGFLQISVTATVIGQTINTVAGNGAATFSGDGGTALSASLNRNTAVHFDSVGNMYIADGANNRIRKINTSGIISTVAGTGATGSSGDGGPATSARLNSPSDIAFDAAGNMYIADYLNNRIRKVDASGVITTYAGTGTVGSSGDGGLATVAKLFHPQSMVIDDSGRLYFCDEGNDRIRMINSSGIITLYAGSGSSGLGDGGLATSASLFRPGGIAINRFGNIIFSDAQNHRIREINAAGIINTIAGTGVAGFSGDSGLATSAKINQSSSLCIDEIGNIYIADVNNRRIRKIDTFGNISTVAGNGSVGFSGDGGPAIDARLNGPSGVCISNRALFIGDAVNNRVRAISCIVPVVVSPVAWIDSICPSDSFQFQCSPSGGSWSNYHSALASISATGMLTAISTGRDTVKYIFTDDCGSDSVIFAINIRSAASCGLSVTSETTDECNLKIFPNPTTGRFSLTFTGNVAELVNISIYNIIGEKIKEIYLPPSTITDVDLNQPPGLYIVIANSETIHLTSKILIR